MMKSFLMSPMRNIVGQMPDTIQAIQHLGIVAMMSTCVSSTSTWTNHSSARHSINQSQLTLTRSHTQSSTSESWMK